MYADSLEELHALALKIGMKLDWFQNKGSFPHYDLTTPKRALAVKLGAVEHTLREQVAFRRAVREKATMSASVDGHLES